MLIVFLWVKILQINVGEFVALLLLSLGGQLKRDLRRYRDKITHFTKRPGFPALFFFLSIFTWLIGVTEDHTGEVFQWK